MCVCVCVSEREKRRGGHNVGGWWGMPVVQVKADDPGVGAHTLKQRKSKGKLGYIGQ